MDSFQSRQSLHQGTLDSITEVTIDKANTRLLTLLKLQTTRYIKQ